MYWKGKERNSVNSDSKVCVKGTASWKEYVEQPSLHAARHEWAMRNNDSEACMYRLRERRAGKGAPRIFRFEPGHDVFSCNNWKPPRKLPNHPRFNKTAASVIFDPIPWLGLLESTCWSRPAKSTRLNQVIAPEFNATMAIHLTKRVKDLSTYTSLYRTTTTT
jgi:hypothetical protein